MARAAKTSLEDEESLAAEQPEGRDRNLATKPAIKKKLLEVFADVEKGFQDQQDRANDLMDWWDIYNCELGSRQFYNGTSQIFVPIVHNAIEARVTRFVNQMFPQSGRYVEVTTEDGEIPHALMALAEYYVRKAKLRTKVVPALMRNGDVEGQYSIYVEWAKHKRHVAMRVQKDVEVEGIPVPDEKVEDIREETLEEGHPTVDVIADTDICVLPATADTFEEALEANGSVTILRRWSKGKLKKLIAEGAIDKSEGEALIKELNKPAQTGQYNKEQAMSSAAGVKSGESKFALVYETWLLLRVEKEMRLCRGYYGGNERVLGCQLNPLWCDRLPLISAPTKKIQGSFKGISQVKFCADMQYSANDAINMGNDSTAYHLLPIVMTDPEKNPRIGSMVLAQAAIWETSPNDTKFAEFPKLWTDALEVVAAATAQIATTLSVSPAAITQQASRKKLTQAEIANEQQIDILATADVCGLMEESILTPMISLFMEMDHQYRDKGITVRQFGEMGIRAQMEDIPPIAMDKRWQFRWFGVEAARNAQQIQQQVAAVNIIRGIPPQQYPGYQLDLTPVISQLVENTFGPRLAPLIFKDMKSQLSLDPMFENTMLTEGFDLAVHPMDDDAKHLQAHMQAMQEAGDVHGSIRIHMLRHQQSMQLKQQAQAQAQQQRQGPQGQQPGGGGPPRIGAQPGPQRNGQAPPGAIHPDQMQDPQRMPQ